MKTRERLSAAVLLPTLFFLLAACGSVTTSTQPAPSVAVTHTPTATTPASGMTLPPQSATQPSLAPTATPKTQPPTPTPIRANPIPATPSPTSTNTNSGGNGGTSTSASQAAQSVLTFINQERAGAGLPALVMSNALIQSAHKHNLAMLAAGQLSHQLPGEADLGTRITAQGVKWNMVAENIGYGFGGATQTAVSLNQSMFAEKPPNDGHRQNILSGNTLIGIDVIVNPQNSQVWLTEDFARLAA
ncbi:MAG: CAP domain-containing protein [Ktedonobacteraceae bacterium]|nr:CAP domain-containing protein [Ktedonobacteraceae bacterium]